MTVGWFLKGLTQYSDFSTRARRREYWWFLVVMWLVVVALGSFAYVTGADAFTDANDNIVTPTAGDLGFVSWIFIIATVVAAVGLLIPYWAVTVRRLHDRGLSGWFALFLLVLPVVVYIIALLDSQPGDNAYGPDPKASER